MKNPFSKFYHVPISQELLEFTPFDIQKALAERELEELKGKKGKIAATRRAILKSNHNLSSGSFAAKGSFFRVNVFHRNSPAHTISRAGAPYPGSKTHLYRICRSE